MFDMWYEYHPYGFGSQALPAGIFEGLTSLRKLDLGHNALGATPIADGLFDGLTSLQELDLRENPLLKTLPRSVLNLPSGVRIRTDKGVTWPTSGVNRPAAGAPTISGTPRVDETLTASVTGITDADGLTGATYSYQWMTNDGSTDANINGATNSTYELTSSEQGKSMKVQVTFTDDGHWSETLTSAATETVEATSTTTTLSASFPTSAYGSALHTGGDDRPQVVVEFSEAVAAFTKSTPSVSVTAATISSVASHTESGLDNAYIFVLIPTGNDDVTFTLIANGSCDAGAICTSDGTQLTEVPGTRTVPGPEENDPSELSVADAEANEETNTTISFTVKLKPASSETVTVDYATSNGTATAGQDYTATSGTLRFNAGQTTKTIAVAIINDTIDDDNETFTLSLSNAAGAGIDDAQATGTIRSNDGTADALTASFRSMPATHNGDTTFSFQVQFSEDVGISYAKLRDNSFTVNEGDVRGARRVNGRNDLWEITVEPDSREDITITLPGNRNCTTAGAVCTRGNNPRQLSNSPSATVAGPPGEPLTASFANMPAEHNGTEFTFDLSFSENVEAGYARIRDHAFSVNGANIDKAQRKTQGSNQHWTVTVDPDDNGAVSITLPKTTNCSNAGAICTNDERKLSHSTSDTVLGPVGISIADAEVEEGANAVLVFAVALSRAANSQMTVDYATSDGTATAGADYTSTSSTLTIDAGNSSATIEVTVIDDEHNEGSETFTLTLSNASSGELTDASATGTITNHDALPKALIARFGRTVAVHIVEQVEERVNAPRAPGFDGRVAGREINSEMGQQFALDFLQQLGGGYGQQQGQPRAMRTAAGRNDPRFGNGGMTSNLGPQNAIGGPMNSSASMQGLHPGQAYDQGMGMGLGNDRLLQGSSFALNRATSSGGVLSFWSRSAQSQFYGQDGALALNGDVRTSMFGADYSKGRMVTGVSLSHSRGLGRYAGVDSGQVNSAVTGLYPWIGYKASERVTVWTVAGYGAGGLMLSPGAGTAIETGLSMAMAAGGGRGQILGGGEGFGLAFKADTLWVGMRTKAATGPGGNLDSTSAAVSRLRTALEGSQSMTIASRMALTPSVEIGIRQDGGDAETGRGMDLGAGLVLADGVTGLAVDIRVRRLLVHQAAGFAESGMSISVSYNPTPATPLGFTARVSPAWGGESMSGAEALWGRESMTGMGSNRLVGSGGNRLDTEVRYGLPIGARFVGTPRAGVRTSKYGRDYRIGYGMQVLEQGKLNLQLGIDAERRESPLFHLQEQGAGSDQRFLGRATVQW